MTIRRRAVCAATMLCVWAGGAADASPWNRDQGGLFTITRNAWFAASGGDEAAGTARRFEQSSAELYAEYGVTGRVMAGAKLIYAWQGVEEDRGPDRAGRRDRLDGLAEAEGFAQFQLRRWEGGALAVLATASAPVGTTSRLIEGRSFDRAARVGAAVLAGFDTPGGFATVRAGPDLSLGADAHTLRVEGTIGRRLGGRSLLLGEAYLTQSLGGAGPDGVDYSVLRAGPSLILPVRGRVRMQLGGTFDVTGERVDLGASGFVAFWVGER